MILNRFINRLRGFREDDEGSIMIEAVVTLPLLIWVLAATYEFFEVHRYNSARDKASYTVADMISREMGTVTPTYIDNTKELFDRITNDDGVNQLRISVIKYDAEDDEYFIGWSQVRGSGAMTPLRDADVENDHAELPIMDDGEEVIVIESVSSYPSIFDVGIDDITVGTRVVTSPRFAPQILFDDG
ncbi:pilus assembly protein [Roseovarius sp. TE539]|uniref:TadE/TadG family type IV pilus assembly protein n=1 Tax=Roseovarius sp. TE539 TaxID=2249812 RepID=UPI000DDD922A|nr:pilus assembly protein [Roseovarius sp. TE539]RBI72361.1 pilus assembly protein [Roseovarius sp. TE539]